MVDKGGDDMTYDLREQIFSKEYVSIKDIELLYGLGYDEAAKLIRTIKRKMTLDGRGVRLDMQGKLHVQDYLDFYGITDQSRYVQKEGFGSGANESI